MIDLIYQNNSKDNISKCFLDIVIPTFDRPERVLSQILYLSQLDKIWYAQIIIIDNNSSAFLSEKQFALIKDLNINIKFYRNRMHIGPDANVLRALELAENNWVHLLGDSKILNKNYINFVLEIIDNNSNINSIVFSYDKILKSHKKISNLDDFLNSQIKYGDLFLGANSLIDINTIKKYIHICSQLTVTRSILSIFHILNLRDNRTIYFSEITIVQSALGKKGIDPRLSFYECWAQFNLIVNLQINIDQAKKLNKKILKEDNFKNYWIFVKYTLIKIFREKSDISRNLNLILNYRYTFKSFSCEKLFIYPLLLLSFVLRKLKFTKFKKYEIDL